VNSIRCKSCGDVIVSEHVHDFKSCKCGAVFVDGGSQYARRGWPSGNPEDHFEEVTAQSFAAKHEEQK